MRRTILISNRLPVTIETDDQSGQQTLVDSVGGLVSGLKPLHEEGDSLWVGYAGNSIADATRKELIDRNLIPVDIDADDYRLYYDGYANNAIWPLFHYFTEFCSFVPEEFEAYERVNQRFASAVAKLAKPGDIIWVHDYHLMLLPKMLRDMSLDAKIGFFLHIPFPADETFRILPQREDILRGLLGADLIGMHTYEYTGHYIQSTGRVLGTEVEGRTGEVKMRERSVRVEARPLGIDVKAMCNQAYSEEAERYLKQLKRTVGDRQVILGVDRLDYTKGLLLKLRTLERLFERSPRWAERVLYIQLAVPTRERIATYQELKGEVERRVSEINGIHGTPVQQPISYLYQTVSPAELGALYRLSDVCFVSPMRDGLNLVAKEYVACREDGGGVLVLSEFAGAISELGESLRINPWDIEGSATQLERALEMGFGERNERMTPMRNRVIANDIHVWVEQFMSSMEHPEQHAPRVPSMIRSSVLADTIASEFVASNNALFMLDYDGSLREFSDRFEDAKPTKDILDLLSKLASLNNVRVFINSGRDHRNLEQWFGNCPIDMIAEHGAWIWTREAPKWVALGRLETSWKTDVEAILQDYVERTPGSRLENKDTALVWHYRQTDQKLGDWQAMELASMLETSLRNEPVEVLHGSKVVEIRQQGLSKARAYDHVIERFGPFDFVLATGDDRTDEGLFNHVGNDIHTVKIGAGSSAARSALSSPRALRDMLRTLYQRKNKNN